MNLYLLIMIFFCMVAAYIILFQLHYYICQKILPFLNHKTLSSFQNNSLDNMY